MAAAGATPGPGGDIEAAVARAAEMKLKIEKEMDQAYTEMFSELADELEHTMKFTYADGLTYTDEESEAKFLKAYVDHFSAGSTAELLERDGVVTGLLHCKSRTHCQDRGFAVIGAFRRMVGARIVGSDEARKLHFDDASAAPTADAMAQLEWATADGLPVLTKVTTKGTTLKLTTRRAPKIALRGAFNDYC